jgi:hypothetical protein
MSERKSTATSPELNEEPRPLERAMLDMARKRGRDVLAAWAREPLFINVASDPDGLIRLTPHLDVYGASLDAVGSGPRYLLTIACYPCGLVPAHLVAIGEFTESMLPVAGEC